MLIFAVECDNKKHNMKFFQDNLFSRFFRATTDRTVTDLLVILKPSSRPTSFLSLLYGMIVRYVLSRDGAGV